MKSFQTKIYLAATCLLWIVGGALAFHAGNADTFAIPDVSYAPSSEAPLDAESTDDLTYTDEENNDALYQLQLCQNHLDDYMTTFSNYWTTTTNYYKSVAMECLGIIREKYETAYNGIQELIDTYYPDMQLPGHGSIGLSYYDRFCDELVYDYYTQYPETSTLVNTADTRQRQSNVIENEEASNVLLGYQVSLKETYDTYRDSVSTKVEPISSIYLSQLQDSYENASSQLQSIYDNHYWTYELPYFEDEIESTYNTGMDDLYGVYQQANNTIHSETVTEFSSPSFRVTLAPNGGTAQYFNSSYYRLGGGGSLTLHSKSNAINIVGVRINLQAPARSGNDVVVSAGTLIGDSIAGVGDTTLTITARGSWPQLWITSLEVTYEGIPPYSTYAIRLPQHLAHGTLTSDRDWANEGDMVTLTAMPDDDYHLKLLYANQGEVTLMPSATSAYKYTFTMPAEDVTIGALFAEGAITTGVILNMPEDKEASAHAAHIYNLQGLQVAHPRNGIYLQKGKKMLLRSQRQR